MPSNWRELAGRTLDEIADLVADFIGLVALLLCVFAVSYVLHLLFSQDPFFREILTWTHEGGSVILFALFIWRQVRRYLPRGQRYDLVVA